jgi:hypothetical protein
MDRLLDFLEQLKRHGWAHGNFLGMLNVLIGRRVTGPDGALVSDGVTWRALAAALRQLRWNKEAVRDLGLEPRDLPPRDREKYWYTAISRAGVDSADAVRAGDRFAQKLERARYTIGHGPRRA